MSQVTQVEVTGSHIPALISLSTICSFPGEVPLQRMLLCGLALHFGEACSAPQHPTAFPPPPWHPWGIGSVPAGFGGCAPLRAEQSLPGEDNRATG